MNRYGFSDGSNVRPGIDPRTLRAIGVMILIIAGAVAIVWLSTL